MVRAQHPNRFNIIQPMFNEANLLERLDVWLERPLEPEALLDPQAVPCSPVGVANIDYDAKGQRKRIDYKTQDTEVIRTEYTYDEETSRLAHLYTRRGVDPQTALGMAFGEDCDNPAPPPDTIPAPATPPAGKSCGLQNLHYTYDPAGNITHIQDDAQQTIYFRNQRVEPSNDYTYDALYRLIQATGREHLGQAGAPIPHSYNDAGRVGVLSANPAGRFAPNDVSAMGTYAERYLYDAVGNFLQMRHERSDAAAPGWTRRYAYAEASLVEPLKQSNRLSSTTVGNAPSEVYGHDAHGNMLRMPQLQDMLWDFKDQLRLTRRQRVNDDDADGIEREGEGTYYVYDASGQRVRKVTELSPDRVKDERIYLGGFEIFRKHGGAIGSVDASTAVLERETLHVMDNKQRIALVETRSLDRVGNDRAPPQLIRYQLGNHLGSASLELDEQQQIISYEEYAPYGSSVYQAVRSQTETAKRYRYTGKERDVESGLCYHGARYYSVLLARWMSCDPIGILDGLSVYSYAANSPVRYFDSSGRQKESKNDDLIDLVKSLFVLSSDDPIFKAVSILEVHKETESARKELEDHYALGNTGPESEATLQELKAKLGSAAAGEISLSAQVLEQEMGKIGADLATPAPIPRPPPTAIKGSDPISSISSSPLGPHAPGDVPDSYSVVRGGKSELPPPGEIISGTQGTGVSQPASISEAASYVPHGQIRVTTAGQIRQSGGTVQVAPEIAVTGRPELNYAHVNITEGPVSTFSPLQPNPITPSKARMTGPAIMDPKKGGQQ